MAVNPTISVIYTKRIEGKEGGGNTAPKAQKRDKKTSSSWHFSGIKGKVKKNIGTFLLGSNTARGMALYTAGMQTAKFGVGLYTQVDEARTGNTIRNYNLRQSVNMIANPIGFTMRSAWNYGVIQPMIIARQNEAMMYDRVLTGQMVYSEGKQKGIF